MGYRKQSNEFVLEKRVRSDILEAISLDCYVASVEMEIYHDIYLRVKEQGYTYTDVHRCRLHCNEGSEGSEIWIFKHCTPSQKPPDTGDTPSFSSYEFKPRTHNNNNTPVSQTKDKYYIPPDLSVNMEASSIRTSGMEPATIDEHMNESMRLLKKEHERQGPLPTVPPPSYQSSAMYSSGQRDQDWGHVNKTVEQLGQKYTDPGGRGDILRGDNMVPTADSPAMRNIMRTSGNKPLISIVRDTRKEKQLFVDGDSSDEIKRSKITTTSPPNLAQLQLSPNKNKPDARHPHLSDNLRKSDMKEQFLSNLNTESSREHSVPFSTFGRSPEGKPQSPLSPEYNAARSKQDKFKVERIAYREREGSGGDEYVSLSETVRNTGALTREGKPSFQDNFQQTTQRFYQSDSCHSLPHFNDNSSRASMLKNISQTVPARPNDDKVFMRSTSADMWQCEKCTLANEKNDTVCKVCGASRNKGKIQNLTVGGNQCVVCTFVNEPGSKECEVCKANLKSSPTYI